MQKAHAHVPIRGLSRQPSEAARNALLDPNDTVLLLLDHQSGLFQTVKDVPIAQLRINTIVLAKGAQLVEIPIFTTASEPDGPNGPLMPELYAAAPDAKYVPRKGEISAWDNADFVDAVQATGRKTLIIAGVWTSVCVAFPALEALADGYTVYFVTDASGDMSEMASCTTLARLTQAGCIPVTTNVVVSELQRSWNRPDAERWSALYQKAVPHYRALVESHARAREVASDNP
jgi:nicotinamidase-related amidase